MSQLGERSKVEELVSRAGETTQGNAQPVRGHRGRADVTPRGVGRECRQDDSPWPDKETGGGGPFDPKDRMMMARDRALAGDRPVAVADCPARDRAIWGHRDFWL